jgi:thioredoxin-like negative regulator of GroEL
MLLLSRSLVYHCPSGHSIIARLLHTPASVPLLSQMKRLINEEQCDEALSLFDAHTRKRRARITEIVEALKACAKMRDIERGRTILRSVPTNWANDPYLQASLINFYRKHICIPMIYSHSFLSSTMR